MTLINHLVYQSQVHEIQTYHFNRNTLTQLMNVVSNLFVTADSSHLHLLLDLRQGNDLLLRVLAHELRRVASQHSHISACIAIVITDSLALEFVEKTIHTILSRDRVHAFVDIEKAHFWLELERDKVT